MRFIFACGIENSYPTIAGENGENTRRDELESTGFYRRWKEDFSLLPALGVTHLRYGPQYYSAHRGPEQYDWAFADETLAELRRIQVSPIADLCHFGVPDWIGDFQNPDWPPLFAEYARAFAERFPWITCFTPVNEIFVTATYSAKNGWWNERLSSDGAWVTALKHLCKANVLAEEAILKVQPKALFIQSEATSYFHERTPRAIERARQQNEKRFLSFDLSYGHTVDAAMFEFLMDNGLARHEYHWFMEHGGAVKAHCIMGSDYYAGNEHWVPEHGPLHPSGTVFGYALLVRQYLRRYCLPVMLTETNCLGLESGPDWLWKQWCAVRELKSSGVPIVGFTWYSLVDQVDWDCALRSVNNRVNPVGLYDLNRDPHPVSAAYRDLIEAWRDEMLGIAVAEPPTGRRYSCP